MSAAELKEKGNDLFKKGRFIQAIDSYSEALKLSDNKHEKAVFFKNRAAAHLKQGNFQQCIDDCTQALDVTASDTKALFRREQAHEELGQYSQAYNDARRLLQIEPKNKTFQKIAFKLRQILEVKLFEERSTENRVKRMLELLFDFKAPLDDRHKAAGNLVVLSKEEDGCEQIFREAGPQSLTRLLELEDHTIRLQCIRTIASLCKGHRARSLVMLREISAEHMIELMSVKDSTEDISNAAFSLIQSIVDSFFEITYKDDVRMRSNDVQADFQRDLFHILCLLKDLLVDPKCSADGRDNAIGLIAKNVPRTDIREGTNQRVMAFLGIDGVRHMLEVAGHCQDPTSSPFDVTKNTRLNCAVALTKLYDDLGGDAGRQEWNDRCLAYIQELFKMGEMDSATRALSAITCLLEGPFDCGQMVLGGEGVLETMVAMTGAEEENCQVAAVEAIITSASKRSKANFVVENGTTLLKTLFRKSESDAVRVRALVGLCKLGASHGGDVSIRSFADGSTIKLAKQCKKFLTNAVKDFETRKWAAEGLSYLTLDADVKEDLVRDPVAVKALVDLAKSKDKTVMYGVVSCLVNCTNTFDKNEAMPEMKDLAKFSKQHIPEDHEKDAEEYVQERIKLLVQADMIGALVALTNLDSAMQSDSTKELLCRVYNVAVANEENRGACAAAGGGKALVPLANEGTQKGKRFAAQALARMAITTDPTLAFPGQRSLEVVRALKQLLNVECDALMNYECLMALTNLASVDETHRRRIMREKMVSDIESYAFEEHEALRRAAVECLCNMSSCKDFIEMCEIPTKETVKLLCLLCAEDDAKTRTAASGALAILTSESEKLAKRVRDCCKSWLENLCIVCLDEDEDEDENKTVLIGNRIRGLVLVRNIIEHDKLATEEIVKSNLFEILVAHSRDTEPQNKQVMELSLDILNKLAEDKFIQPANK